MAREQVAFQPSWGKRIVGMEGLRAVAAIGVLVGHTQVHLAPSVSWGPAAPIMAVALNGLTLFFALSGFLLFRPFATALLTGERFPIIGRYAANRLLRIYPAYIVILLLVSLVLGVAYATPQLDAMTETRDTVGYMTDPALLGMNLTMLQTLLPFSLKTGLGVAWSLTVELVFYVVMPAVAILTWAIVKRTRMTWGVVAAVTPIAAIFVIGAIGKLVKRSIFDGLPEGNDFIYEWGGNWYAVLARSFFAHADLFAFGMFAALLIAAFETGTLNHRHARPARVASASAAVFGFVAARLAPGDFGDTAYAAAFGAVIFFVALPSGNGSPGIFARVLETLPFRYVGLVSYSFYLWHLPVIWLMVRLGWAGENSWPGLLRSLGVAFVITLALASITYYGVEKPAMRLKRRTDRGTGTAPRRETWPAHVNRTAPFRYKSKRVGGGSRE
ncbi:acyltransferase family protein [Microbacterium sp. LWH3-1.2]|uniref:acyltransferase family protein n=1 Tax=Microbacterium sp. LWH3-1.2 TaxID=3135256 RepID=UPI003434D128